MSSIIFSICSEPRELNQGTSTALSTVLTCNLATSYFVTNALDCLSKVFFLSYEVVFFKTKKNNNLWTFVMTCTCLFVMTTNNESFYILYSSNYEFFEWVSITFCFKLIVLYCIGFKISDIIIVLYTSCLHFRIS